MLPVLSRAGIYHRKRETDRAYKRIVLWLPCRIPNHGLRGVQRAREFLLPAGHSAQMNSLVPMLLAIEVSLLLAS